MSPVKEAGLTCLREVRRNLRSLKGIVMGVLFLIGGSAASLIYAALSAFAEKLRAGQQIPEEVLREQRASLWGEVWTEEIGKYLADAPLIFVALYKASIWFIPFMVLLVGFEQLSGDFEHRTIRYVAIRARRSSIVAGKAMGIWVVVSSLLLALHVFVWLVSMVRGTATFAQTLAWGPRMWALSTLFVAAYAGFTILVSSTTRRPVISLFLGMIIFSFLWVLDLAIDGLKSLKSPDYEFLEPISYIIPDFYDQWLVTPRAPEMIGGIAILLAFGAATTAAAAWVVNRRDI